MFYSNVETMRKLNLPKTWSKLHRTEYQIRHLKKNFSTFQLVKLFKIICDLRKSFSGICRTNSNMITSLKKVVNKCEHYMKWPNRNHLWNHWECLWISFLWNQHIHRVLLLFLKDSSLLCNVLVFSGKNWVISNSWRLKCATV